MTVEYGRKPYLSKSYNEMARRITDKQINDQKLLHQSELKKPYYDSTYQEMEHFYRPPWDNPKNPYPYFPEPPAPDIPPIIDGGNPHPTFPCDPPGTIGYTTLQMQVNEVQTLSIINPTINGEYTWSLSGGGTLALESGESTAYTAPATNANCSNNGTVYLYCDGTAVDSVTFSINAVGPWNQSSNPGIAYKYLSCTDTVVSTCPPGHPVKTAEVSRRCPETCYDCMMYEIISYVVHCPNEGLTCVVKHCDDSYPEDCSCSTMAECGRTYALSSGIVDVRTDEMKAAGCCPGALF
jgi:hypothetical protein